MHSNLLGYIKENWIRWLGILICLAIFASYFTPKKFDAEWAMDSVVTIEYPNGQVAGTGFFFSPEACVLTADHVAMPNMKVRLRGEVRRYTAKTVYSDNYLDLAVVCISDLKRAHPWLTLRETIDVKPGDRTYVVGHPDGSEWNVTSGVVNKISFRKHTVIEHVMPPMPERHFDIAIAFTRYTMITSAFVLPGSSGSPVLDVEGRVIGLITTMGPSGIEEHVVGHMNSAVTGSDLIRFVKSLME